MDVGPPRSGPIPVLAFVDPNFPRGLHRGNRPGHESPPGALGALRLYGSSRPVGPLHPPWAKFPKDYLRRVQATFLSPIGTGGFLAACSSVLLCDSVAGKCRGWTPSPLTPPGRRQESRRSYSAAGKPPFQNGRVRDRKRHGFLRTRWTDPHRLADCRGLRLVDHRPGLLLLTPPAKHQRVLRGQRGHEPAAGGHLPSSPRC